MAKNRMDLINAEIQKSISKTLTYDVHNDALKNSIITVTKVETTHDLKYCKIFVSVFPDNKREEIFNNLNITIPFIRRELAHNVKLRLIPELHFYLDDSLEYAQKINKIIDKIKK